jgi:hypothetical protein
MGSKGAVSGAQEGADRPYNHHKDDTRLACQRGDSRRTGRGENQSVQNLNQPELEEVGRSDKGATSGSPMGGSGREAG